MFRPHVYRSIRRTTPMPISAAPCIQPTATAPGNNPLVIVIVVLVLASALAGDGRPVVTVLQLLAGAGLVATEVVRRIHCLAVQS